MFDGKTVTAVFVSLAIIAVLTSGQQLSAPNDLDGADFDLGSLLPSGEDNSVQDRPTPNNTVNADFTAELNNETLNVYNTNLTSQGLTSIESQGIDADNPVTLRDFTGTVQIHENGNITVIGEAQGYETSVHTDMGSFEINNTHSTSNIEMETVKLQHSFNQTNGYFQFKGNRIEDSTQYGFNSFTGTITIDLTGQNVQMDGKADTLTTDSSTIN